MVVERLYLRNCLLDQSLKKDSYEFILLKSLEIGVFCSRRKPLAVSHQTNYSSCNVYLFSYGYATILDVPV